MELAVYVDSLRKAGFDASQRVVPVQQIRDPQLRSLLPGLQLRGGAYQPMSYTSDQIPRPQNHWNGDNRGGWSNPDYDHLFNSYMTTLDESERVGQLAQMERLISEEVPSFRTCTARTRWPWERGSRARLLATHLKRAGRSST